MVLAAVLLLLPHTLEARKRPSENQFLKQAQAAEDRKDWDTALDLYRKALAIDPHNMVCQIGLQRVKFEDGQFHLQKGRALREQGHPDEALAEFQKGFGADPGSTISLQEINATLKMIEEAKKGGPEKPADERGLTPVQIERKKMDDRLRSIEGIPELKPIQREISTLKMNNQPPKVLYETVGKLAGINVIIDPQFQPAVKNANLDLSNTNLEDALDYIALLTHTFWKPITANAIFVTDDNPTKRRDYETLAVKTFYLQNPATPQEFQEIVTAVRSVTDCRRIFTFAALNAIVARCEVDKLGLVEKVVHDLDKPKAEVLVDVLVLDVNTTHTRDLAATIQQAGGGSGLNVPVAFSGPISAPTGASGGTGTATSSINLAQLGHVSINQFTTSLPGALLEAVLSDSDTRVLQSPQLRASDGGKATLNIGSKIPFASGSYQAGVAGVGVSGLVQTQFQYADVGVNVTLQPHVHGDSEITMHVQVDISTVTGEQNFSGLEEPIIGQKKNESDIRVRDGEVTLLGGLMNTTDTDTSAGIPGLVSIPILGKLLFGNQHRERDKEELLIAVIPHIVRTQDVDELDMRGVASGTEGEVQLRYAHPDHVLLPPITQPAENPAPGGPTVTAPMTTAPMVTAPAAPSAPAPESKLPATGPRVTFNPAILETRVANPVIATLKIENAMDVFSVAARVKWDPRVLRLNAITPGQFLSSDGQKVNAPVDIRNDAGEATITLTRLPGAQGVSGTGPLVTFAFTAMAPGATNISVTELAPKNSKQESIEAAAPAVAVVVK
jgi:general secretion pathway protein D